MIKFFIGLWLVVSPLLWMWADNCLTRREKGIDSSS